LAADQGATTNPRKGQFLTQTSLLFEKTRV
jgi:hypothetical protein